MGVAMLPVLLEATVATLVSHIVNQDNNRTNHRTRFIGLIIGPNLSDYTIIGLHTMDQSNRLSVLIISS